MNEFNSTLDPTDPTRAAATVKAIRVLIKVGLSVPTPDFGDIAELASTGERLVAASKGSALELRDLIELKDAMGRITERAGRLVREAKERS